MKFNEEALALFTEGYEKILQGLRKLGYDPDQDENFHGTAFRSAKYTEMVISKHNVAFGVCPHHLLPVIYRISLAYIPVSKVLGLSKLTRLARLYARSPSLQEDLTHELCRILHEDLDSQGSAVYVEGLHLCMAARGVGAHESRLVTSAVRGVFLTEMATREEFIKLVTASHPSLI
jgi:GTP cyclohydrolase IA